MPVKPLLLARDGAALNGSLLYLRGLDVVMEIVAECLDMGNTLLSSLRREVSRE